MASAFAQPHSILEMTEDPRGMFLGYQTLLNVKSNAAAQAAPGFHQFPFHPKEQDATNSLYFHVQVFSSDWLL